MLSESMRAIRAFLNTSREMFSIRSVPAPE